MSDYSENDYLDAAQDTNERHQMNQIIAMDYTELLRTWRFSPTGNPLLSGTGPVFQIHKCHRDGTYTISPRNYPSALDSIRTSPKNFTVAPVDPSHMFRSLDTVGR